MHFEDKVLSSLLVFLNKHLEEIVPFLQANKLTRNTHLSNRCTPHIIILLYRFNPCTCMCTCMYHIALFTIVYGNVDIHSLYIPYKIIGDSFMWCPCCTHLLFISSY